MFITASKIYDYIQCPHKVWRDVYGPQEEKIKDENPFVELLWERGAQHEKDVISRIGSFIDLSEGELEERINKTLAEMKKGTPLIYQGVISVENLLGIPDLLRRTSSGEYVPIDIKSGKGFQGEDFEGDEEGKPKKHYAVQLALYVEILLKMGFIKDKKGLIIDISGEEVSYSLESPQGPKNTQTWWELYLKIKEEIVALLSNKSKNQPALAGVCKQCLWHDSCKKWCIEHEDLTRIFYLGRSGREVLNKDLGIKTVMELKGLNIDDLLARKKRDKQFLKGFGEALLQKFITRADVLLDRREPLFHQQILFPEAKYELFFDIEDDPTQDFVYLHGVYQRIRGKEEYIYFLAETNTREAEKAAWNNFWEYIASLPAEDCAVYYYSAHEKTTYRRLGKRYAGVIEKEKLESFFQSSQVIDLYKIVTQNSEWPLSSYSVKEIASYLGFKWRDSTPSGALSIRWYNDYLLSNSKDTLRRILEYNEDDCKAMMVLKDGLVRLSS